MPPSGPGPIRLDARRSPAHAIRRDLLDTWRRRDASEASGPADYDRVLMWLTASDRLVSDQAARALLEVRERRLHVQQGHARFLTYLKAFVPKTPRWCQQEMSRARKLRDFPDLAAAWEAGEIGKSHLRVILRVVTAQTEAVWAERGRTCTVRQLEALATRQAQASVASGAASGGGGEQADEDRLERITVMAPPAVAALVGQAVDLARKMDGYQIPAGEAVSHMAIDVMVSVDEWPDAPADAEPAESGCPARSAGRAVGSWLGDARELRRQLGPEWQSVLEHFEAVTGCWKRLPWEAMEVTLRQAPSEDAPAHERAVFWTRLQGRLDAVRGRLLRIMQGTDHVGDLGFGSLGHYARERMGLSAREAQELVRLDLELDELPVAFRAYAAGRLGVRAAWLVARVARRQTDRAWTRYALTHSLRLLEAVVEASVQGGLPKEPMEMTYPEAIRACSHSEDGEDPKASVAIGLVMTPHQRLLYEQAVEALRRLHGRHKPDWWCLAVMAHGFIDAYADADEQAVDARLRRMIHRRVIERDEYTCVVPECPLRGGLESDHMDLLSQGGPTTMENLRGMCGCDHRFMKHQAGTIRVWGKAPDEIMVRMGERLYSNDRLVSPRLDESILEEDPWEETGSALPGAGLTQPHEGCPPSSGGLVGRPVPFDGGVILQD